MPHDDAIFVFEPPEHLIVARTEGWIVGQRVDSVLPGYFMIAARTPTVRLAEMPADALEELGAVAAKAQKAVETILSPEVVYISRYGHDPGFQFHLHVIPVCRWLIVHFEGDPRYQALRSLRRRPEDNGPDGGELTLYVWREFCRTPNPPAIPGPQADEVIERARAFFA